MHACIKNQFSVHHLRIHRRKATGSCSPSRSPAARQPFATVSHFFRVRHYSKFHYTYFLACMFKFSSAVLCSVRRKRKLFYHHWAAHSFPPKINFPSDGSGSCFTTIGRLIFFRRDAANPHFDRKKCMHVKISKTLVKPLGPSLGPGPL